MGFIKDIYDVTKDGVLIQRQIVRIKRALLSELNLNRKCLKDIEKGMSVDNHRYIRIIENLSLDELTDAVKCEIPYELICNKKVDHEIMGSLSIARADGYNFEKLVNSLYQMIAYIKKDFDNESINLKSKLEFIYKYNMLLIRLLQ